MIRSFGCSWHIWEVQPQLQCTWDTLDAGPLCRPLGWKLWGYQLDKCARRPWKLGIYSRTDGRMASTVGSSTLKISTAKWCRIFGFEVVQNFLGQRKGSSEAYKYNQRYLSISITILADHPRLRISDDDCWLHLVSWTWRQEAMREESLTLPVKFWVSSAAWFTHFGVSWSTLSQCMYIYIYILVYICIYK